MASAKGACDGVALAVVAAVILAVLIGFVVVINSPRTYVTVSLVNARGLDVDEQTSTTPVEFEVAIGFQHLEGHFAVGHDGGTVTISYAGIKLGEGPVPKFYVAGGPKWVEATRAVAAGEDQAPLSQMFRDHLWVDQQLDGIAEFDVALRFFDVNITTGETTFRSS